MDVDVSHSEWCRAEGMAPTPCTAPDPTLLKMLDTFPELYHSVLCSAFHLQSSTHTKDVYWVSSATSFHFLMEILCNEGLCRCDLVASYSGIKIGGGNRDRIQIFAL